MTLEKFKDNVQSDETKEPRQARMILVKLKRPVRLPVSIIDAIALAGIEKVCALDEPLERGTL